MGTIVSSIFSGGIKGLADTAKDIIEEFHTSPEEKDRALARLAASQQAALDSARDYEVKLNDVAGQNIRADAASQDKFTERARPTFMYIIEFILLWNYVGMSILGACGVKGVGPVTLPADLLWLFGVCVTGYVFARSADKTLALPGSSQVSVMGGVIKGSNSAPTT